MEIISNGSLPYGYSLEDFLSGLSICRNSKLAQVFYHLNQIEAYGTGLAKILSSYRTAILKPQFIPTQNVFKVILPKTTGTKEGKENKEKEFAYGTMDSVEEKDNFFLKENGLTSRQCLEQTIEGSPSTTVRIRRRLKDKGRIKTEGNGKNIRYDILEQNRNSGLKHHDEILS